MKQTNGKVSIIMAAYNAEKTICRSIDSVLAQTYSDFELLVVNDCSKDRTQEIIKGYSQRDARVKLIDNPHNMGVSYTRLNGLNAAAGEWIAVLDSDDAWLPEKLEKQMELQKQTNAVLLYTGSGFVDDDGRSIDWVLNVPEKVTYRELLKQNILSNSSALCRKDLYSKHYAIGDGMHEDFALWLNILKGGEVAYGVNEPLLIYRVSNNSKSGNKIRAAKMNWNTYRAVGLSLYEAAYYQLWYALNNVKKYIAIRMHQ